MSLEEREEFEAFGRSLGCTQAHWYGKPTILRIITVFLLQERARVVACNSDTSYPFERQLDASLGDRNQHAQHTKHTHKTLPRTWRGGERNQSRDAKEVQGILERCLGGQTRLVAQGVNTSPVTTICTGEPQNVVAADLER